jgi:pyruvate dehydrogenase E1 component beta subunit
MIAAIRDNNPVVYIDDRWLYNTTGDVPEGEYTVPIGKGAIRKEGTDLTLVAFSYLALESLKAAMLLEKYNLSAEVVDLRSIKPFDDDLIFESVRKTGRLVIVDGGWKTCGVAAEISARVFEQAFEFVRFPVIRITLPDVPAPASSILEEAYYPKAESIVSTIRRHIEGAKERRIFSVI